MRKQLGRSRAARHAVDGARPGPRRPTASSPSALPARPPKRPGRPRRRWLSTLLVALLGGCAAPAEPPRPPPAPAPSAPRVPRSFEQAKRLAWDIYRDHPITLYCQCEYDRRHRVQRDGCGYEPRRPGKRARRVEWEHLVPAYELGAHRACWRPRACTDSRGRRFGGRRCCRERDPEFARMEADLMNLSPEIGELNADRSHFAFGEVPGEARRYGRCDFEVDRDTGTVEPAPGVRGDIARAYLYMHEVYGQAALPLAPEAVARFQAWHRADPPSAWERVRNARITAIQGVSNPWLER